MSGTAQLTLDRDQVALVVVDIQEKLCRVMDQKVLERLVKNVGILLTAAETLSIPVVGTEQYVKGLGELLPEIRTRIGGTIVEKLSFSCCGEPGFTDRLRELGRNQLLVVGMEAHICVLQTVLDLIGSGFTVHLVRDAVMSRRKENWETALEIVRSAGGVVTTTEIALFQLLKRAGTAEFRALSPLVREG